MQKNIRLLSLLLVGSILACGATVSNGTISLLFDQIPSGVIAAETAPGSFALFGFNTVPTFVGTFVNGNLTLNAGVTAPPLHFEGDFLADSPTVQVFNTTGSPVAFSIPYTFDILTSAISPLYSYAWFHLDVLRNGLPYDDEWFGASYRTSHETTSNLSINETLAGGQSVTYLISAQGVVSEMPEPSTGGLMAISCVAFFLILRIPFALRR